MDEQVRCRIAGRSSDNNANLDINAGVAGTATGAGTWTAINSEYTDTIRNIRYVDNANDAGMVMNLFTMGWIDNRGQ
jgi:hypothetical protein